jgi:hypothetical protein
MADSYGSVDAQLFTDIENLKVENRRGEWTIFFNPNLAPLVPLAIEIDLDFVFESSMSQPLNTSRTRSEDQKGTRREQKDQATQRQHHRDEKQEFVALEDDHTLRGAAFEQAYAAQQAHDAEMQRLRRVERVSAKIDRDSNPHTTWRADFPHHAVQDLLHSTANDFILTSGIFNTGCCIGNRSMIFVNFSHVI